VDKELDVIRNQMEQTRSSLADKLEALENQVRGTVEDATSAVTNTVETVQETVENVKEGVQEAVGSVVDTVKDTFNVRKHVERHPWAMVGGAVMLGAFAGMLVNRRSRRRRPAAPAAVETVGDVPVRPAPGHRNGHGHGNGHHGASRKAAKAASTQTGEPGPFQSSLKSLKGLAIGTLMGVLRDVLVDAVPSNLAPELSRVVDDMTTKLGGKTLRSFRETDEAHTGQEGSTENVGSDSPEMGRPMGATRWSR
jgi:ElaB/YqjD/DUF883 family membrane-anchored ribosome-binding protein